MASSSLAPPSFVWGILVWGQKTAVQHDGAAPSQARREAELAELKRSSAAELAVVRTPALPAAGPGIAVSRRRALRATLPLTPSAKCTGLAQLFGPAPGL